MGETDSQCSLTDEQEFIDKDGCISRNRKTYSFSGPAADHVGKAIANKITRESEFTIQSKKRFIDSIYRCLKNPLIQLGIVVAIIALKDSKNDNLPLKS